MSDDNMEWDGETMQHEGKTIPVLKVRKWLREVRPQKVRVLCVGPPGDPLWCARDHTAALYDFICGEPAYALSLEHRGFVCEKHADPQYAFVDEDGSNTLEHMFGCWDGCGDPGREVLRIAPQTERANATLQMIEEKLYTLWRKDNPRKRRDKHFPIFLNEFWEGLGKTLTYQVRISTESVLAGTNGDLSRWN